MSQYLSPEQFKFVNEALLEEYRIIRPQMLNLVEAFEFDDNILNSSIGTYDGNIYE